MGGSNTPDVHWSHKHFDHGTGLKHIKLLKGMVWYSMVWYSMERLFSGAGNRSLQPRRHIPAAGLLTQPGAPALPTLPYTRGTGPYVPYTTLPHPIVPYTILPHPTPPYLTLTHPTSPQPTLNHHTTTTVYHILSYHTLLYPAIYDALTYHTIYNTFII